MRNQSVKNVWGRRPHTFFTSLLRNLGPQDPLRTHLSHNFNIYIYIFVFSSYLLAYLGEWTTTRLAQPVQPVVIRYSRIDLSSPTAPGWESGVKADIAMIMRAMMSVRVGVKDGPVSG